jgi:hypothetical protein
MLANRGRAEAAPPEQRLNNWMQKLQLVPGSKRGIPARFNSRTTCLRWELLLDPIGVQLARSPAKTAKTASSSSPFQSCTSLIKWELFLPCPVVLSEKKIAPPRSAGVSNHSTTVATLPQPCG